jgi:SM-20-related protein
MTAHELFANLSQVLVQDEEMLAANERELLANVLRRARVQHQSEDDEILQILVCAVGDTIAQRAVAKLGRNISQHILRDPLFVSRVTTSTFESSLLNPKHDDTIWAAGSMGRQGETELLRGMGTPSVPPPSPQPTGPRPPSPGPPSPGITGLESRPITYHMGTPSVPPPSPEPSGPRPPSPGPPSPSTNSLDSRPITHHMGTPSVPPPSPDPKAPRPPSPGPPSTGIDQHPRFAAPRPPSPGPPSPATPIAPSGPLPPSTGPRSAWVTEGSGARVAVSHMPRILPAACVLLDEFLMPSEVEELLAYALEREQQFVISEVITPGVRAGMVDYEHRRSRVLYDLGSPGSLLVNRVEECLPRILPRLEREAFPIARVEAQMTASNHGDFFHWHCDDGQEEVARREITFVYFFHREPKEFQGGDLRIYQSLRTSGGYVPGGEPQIIVPQQNQLVIFPSALAHEITPVECSSCNFGSSRFTVNGWFHR